jgi:two-component system LytT family response regulator
LRVAIVDDEPLARDCMRLALRGAPDVAVVAECANGVEAVTAIGEQAPDVVFLDVQMPGLDGFGVIDRVGADAMPLVVFVTAFDAHAIRAFEVHAMDYVLKPFADERFLAALERARSAVQERTQLALGRKLAALVRDWGATARGAEAASVPQMHDRAESRAALSRFTVREQGRVRFVAASDVDWIEADGNYLKLHVGAVTHRVRGTIAALTAELDPSTFVRVHRSTIVNLTRVRELQPWFGGDYIAILTTGVKVRVSRTRVGDLLHPSR